MALKGGEQRPLSSRRAWGKKSWSGVVKTWSLPTTLHRCPSPVPPLPLSSSSHLTVKPHKSKVPSAPRGCRRDLVFIITGRGQDGIRGLHGRGDKGGGEEQRGRKVERHRRRSNQQTPDKEQQSLRRMGGGLKKDAKGRLKGNTRRECVGVRVFVHDCLVWVSSPIQADIPLPWPSRCSGRHVPGVSSSLKLRPSIQGCE